MASGIWSWSQTAASNATADTSILWSEGQAPDTLNDSARQTMAIIAKWRDDMAGVLPSGGEIVSSGSANAQTLSTNGSIQSLTNGWMLRFRAGFQNTGACTLQVDGMAAKQLQITPGTNLLGGELLAGAHYTVTYKSIPDAWILTSTAGVFPPFVQGTLALFQQTAAPTGWVKQVTFNDRALRVTSGTAGSGGTNSFSATFANIGSGATSLTQAQLPNCNFTISGTANGQDCSSVLQYLYADYTKHTNLGGIDGFWTGVTTGYILQGQFASPSAVSGSAASGGSGQGHGHLLDLRVQYVDVIIASKS